MAQSRYYSATAQPTVLTGGITPTSTSIPLQATTGFPASTPFILALDYNTPSEEIVLCTTLAGTNATVTRAYDGTSATSHNAGAGVRHTWTAMDGNDSRGHEAATIVHGVTSALVGVSDTQTLTNKTLTSPVINGTVTGSATYTSPTITGTVAGGATYSSVFASPSANNVVGFIVKGLAGQTADLQRYTDSTNTLLSAIDSTGVSHWFQGLQVGFTNQFTIAGDGIPHATTGLQAGSANQFAVDASGNTTTSGTLGATGAFTGASNVNTGAWTAYTPTWASSGTQPAIGNGSILGRYVQVGKTVTVMINLVMGTTTTFGTGTYTFTVPFLSVNRMNNAWVGSALGTHVGFSAFVATPVLNFNATAFNVFSPTGVNGASNAWTNAVPFTWASTDIIDISMTYEMA